MPKNPPPQIVVFDLETNSPNPEGARIVTAYLGLLDQGGNVLQEQEWLVRPDYPLTDDVRSAEAVHGVTYEHATAHGVPLAGAVNQIGSILNSEVLGGVPLVGQNIAYDLTCLDREVARSIPNAIGVAQWIEESGAVVIDTLVLDKHLHRYRKGAGARRLINLAAAYGIPFSEEDAHNARFDAVTSGRIALKQLANATLRTHELPALHRAQVAWKAQQAADLQNYFRTKGGKPDAVVDPHWPVQPRTTSATTPTERTDA